MARTIIKHQPAMNGITQFNLEFRQRVENGEYHYWGGQGAGFVPPRMDWGYAAYSEQWIGLLDRDGKKIYVGDVIETEHGHTEVIVFERGSFLHKDDVYEHEGCGGSCWVNRSHIEASRVIGNVMDVFYPKKGKTKKRV